MLATLGRTAELLSPASCIRTEPPTSMLFGIEQSTQFSFTPLGIGRQLDGTGDPFPRATTLNERTTSFLNITGSLRPEFPPTGFGRFLATETDRVHKIVGIVDRFEGNDRPMKTKPILRVFLSHAHDEAGLALCLQQQIRRDFLGLVRVFVSSNRRDLLVGADWFDRLQQEIAAADLFTVLCSRKSLLNPWVNIEIGAACFREHRPLTIPLCHSDLSAGSLDSPLDRKQAIVISSPDGLKGLYERLAQELGSQVPAAGFDVMAEELKRFEAEYMESSIQAEQSVNLPDNAREAAVRVIQNPSVLCISSRQFEKIAKQDYELIRRFLPANLNHEVVMSPDGVRDKLGCCMLDIIHLALYICPVSGDLIFGEIDPETKQSTSSPLERMTAMDFAGLVDVSRTSLLVVTTPEPLSFVAKLLPHTNVVFPSGPVSPESLAKWMQEFYGLLSKSHNLSDACRRASAQYCACMMLYPKLPKVASVAYESYELSMLQTSQSHTSS